ncbi:MAG: hypothetical protein LBU67_04945 [Oscillospiraceae bacterium]|jgi:hypothetical protein|nr:hypothetical protein [Oscillospiraceae bacterium]
MPRIARALPVLALCLCLPVAALAQTFTLTQPIGPDGLPFTFTLDYQVRDEVCYTSSLTVTQKDDGRVIQRITLAPPTQSYDPETLDFVLEDLNFDGYTDMRLLAVLPSGPNLPFLCWLWDAAQGQYVYDEALSAIPTPEADPAAQRIRSFYRDGADTYVEAAYAYIDGALTLVSRTTTTYDAPNGLVWTATEELVNGQLTLTDRAQKTLEADEQPSQ